MSIVDNHLALATDSWAWFVKGDISVKLAGRPVFVTYSFETRPSPDVRELGGFTQAYWDSFQPLTEKQRASAKAALDAWSAASGLVFIEVSSGMGDIRFGVYDFDKGGSADSTRAGGYASYPGGGLGGDVFIGKTSYDGLHIFLHEVGHALGLKHPFDDDPTLNKEFDSYAYTVMSYTQGGLPGDVLGPIDKAAIAYLYGAPGAAMPGTWSWDPAVQTLTQTNMSAGALIRGVSPANVIAAGHDATILPGEAANLITAGDRAAVYWNWGQAIFGTAASTLTLGADAKVDAGFYYGSLSVTAGAGAQIQMQGAEVTPTSMQASLDGYLKLKLGANAKVTSGGFRGQIDIVAGQGANISLPWLTPEAASSSTSAVLSLGANSTVDGRGYRNHLSVAAGDNASVWLGLGAVDVVVGAASTIDVFAAVNLTPKADQVSRFTFGADGIFRATPALATNIVSVGNNASVFGGKGSEIVFVSGKALSMQGGAGVDIAILDASKPAASFAHYDAGSGRIQTTMFNGSANGKDQYWFFWDTEYLQFSDALYSVAKKAYLADFVALKTAHGSLLRASGVETNHLVVADLANRVDGGQLTKAAAIVEIVRTAGATTSVATLSYEFFTGKIPGLAGIDYLVSPTGPNPNNLNSAYYQAFNLENRYINFAVNLGKIGEGNARFSADYGALSLFDATKKAYAAIFGGTPTDAKVTALLAGGRDLYFAAYGGDGANGIGTKAAMVGWLLAEAQKADLGVMVKSNAAWLLDLSDGSAPFSIDILDPAKGYWKADFIFGGS